MSDIYVRKPHQLDYDDAHELMDSVAAELADKLSISYQKDGDTLTFKRTGASGKIQLTDTEIVVEAKLGLMLKALQPMLQSAVENKLNEHC